MHYSTRVLAFVLLHFFSFFFFFFQAEDGIRDLTVTGVQTCALPIFRRPGTALSDRKHGSPKKGAFIHGRTSMRPSKLVLALATLLLMAGVAEAQVKFAYVGEISGSIAVSGGNFRDGVILAVEELNARGGILKQKIELTLYDTQTNPGVARAQMQKAIDGDPYVVLGPIFSGNVKVTMQMLQQAEIPHLIGGEAAELTSLGDPYLFRTSFGQQIGMPKIANFIRDELKAKTVALIWVNNDFGKGGRDRLIKELTARGIKLAADVSSESGQVDFAADVVKLKAANADVVFVYSNEDEGGPI